MFTIESYPELLALHRVVMEAKFHPDPNDELILLSPFVAAIAERLVVSIVDAETSRGKLDSAQRWESWRKLTPERNEWLSLVAQLRRTMRKDPSKWTALNLDEKRELIKIAASPMKLEETLVEALISAVETIL